MDSNDGESGGNVGTSAEVSSGAEPGGLQRVFFCYQCQRRTFPDAEHIENFSCMNCNSSFVEDVTIREDSPSSQSEDQSWAAGLEAAIADSAISIEEALGEAWENESPASSSSSGSRPRPRRSRARYIGPTGGGGGGPIADQFIQTLIANLIGGPGGGGLGGEFPATFIASTSGNGRGVFLPAGIFQAAAGGGGGPSGAVPMMAPLYGNPGDYAWGRGGLDAIVTQLLNQMDGTGPPPMSVDEIKKIPTIKVTQSQIDAKIQCSVCWDDFKLDEDVRQLKCEHIFHQDCIIPWLELHNTCPVCRKEQENVPPDGESDTEPGGPGSSTGNRPDATNDSGVSSSSASSTFGASAGSHPRHASRGGNADIMDAIGRSMSVLNSLFGVPPEQNPSVATATSSHQTGPIASTSVTASAASTATAPPPPPATTAATSVSSVSTTSTTTPSTSQQQPSSRGTGDQFQDMDLE